jgi:hypothetical protein
MYSCDDIIVCTSGQVHGLDTKMIVDKILKHKPKYFILWQVGEFHAPQLMNYLNWDYELNKTHDEDTQVFEDTLLKYDVKCFVVLGGTKSKVFHNLDSNPIKNLKVIFWQTFLIHYSYYGLICRYGNVENLSVTKKYEKLFLSYNNKARKHRCILMDELSKSNLLDYGFISWHGHHKDYDFQHWKEEIMKLDEFEYDLHHTTYSDNLFNIKSFFNLITESDDHNDNLFFTEKTYRTILIEQPFLCLGSQYQNLGLKKLGFELYEEIFDYEFDSETDINKRVTGIIDNIKNLKDQNYNHLYDKIKNKIKHNKNVALSYIKNDPYFPKEIVDLYVKCGDNFVDLFKLWTDDFRTNYPFINNFNIIKELFKNNI